MPDIAAEAKQLADALEIMLESQGKLLMKYVPVGMSCSLGYRVVYNHFHPPVDGKLTLVSRAKP